MRRGVTPRRTFAFEARLARLLWELGRQVVQRAYNQLEPDDRETMPPRVRLGLDEYRRNRKTSHDVLCMFGRIRLKRFVYQAVQPGEPGVFPLEQALGIVAGLATPALGDVIGRLAAELTQQQTLAVLKERYQASCSVGSLRKITAAMAEALTPLRQEAQIEHVIDLLRKAFESKGKHRPTLVAGRDGVMVPMRPCWEEACAATLSVYDRRGQRLGTVYLGRMPEFGQGTMTEQFTQLIEGVLAAWDGPLPRLHYVTDAGHHPQDFFHRVLRKMNHPSTSKSLTWTWSVDYYHACERITKIAEVLFGAGREATAWAEKMRRVMKEKPAGVTRVIQSAQALRRSRGLCRARKEFDTAVAYLSKYRKYMDYGGYRRRGLPIGSGVTEAACKTIFGYRFKQSGMRWHKDHGQHVLDLRTILKSNVWATVRRHWLARIGACQALNTTHSDSNYPQLPRIFTLST